MGWGQRLRAWIAAKSEVPRRQRTILIVTTLILVLMTVVQIRLQIVSSSRAAYNQVNEDAQRQLLFLTNHASHQLGYADSYLRTARHLLKDKPDWPALQETLGQLRANSSVSISSHLLITDRDGKVIFYSESQTPPDMNLAGQDYFITLRDVPRDQLVLGATRKGLISGEYQFRLVRPLLHEGRFNGVILLAIPPETLTGFTPDPDLGPHATSSFMMETGQLLARQPTPQSSFYDLQISGPVGLEPTRFSSGRSLAVSPIDGLSRRYLHARLPDFPILALVGIYEQDIQDKLGTTRSRLLLDGLRQVAAIIVVMLLIARLLVELNRRHALDKSLRRMNQAHQLLSRANQAVTDATSEEDAYQAFCQVIVNHGGYRMAWVGLNEKDSGRHIRPAASAGFVNGYLDLPGITWTNNASGHGPAGQAAQTGQAQVNYSFAQNPAAAPWRAAALERGYGSSIGLPLRGRDQVFGVLSVYAREDDAFGPDEVALFEQLAATLGHSVIGLRQQRENDLMAESLVQAQKMQTLGHLTGGIAHDFNNLLQVILSNLELGLRVAEGSPVARYLSHALDGAEQGAKLTGQLLAFARRQPMSPQPLRITDLVKDMTSLLQRSLGANIQSRIEAAPNLWLALADANQLRNAILNLAINARDAMPEGGQLTIGLNNVTVSVPRGDLEPGEYVSLSISDTGTGMTAEVMSQAFNPFFTTKPEGVGTGLGLSMVHGFLKQSGGHVTIESALGLGTCVTLYLPRTTLEQAPPKTAAPVPHGQGQTILLLEPDASLRGPTTDQLIGLGYHVRSVETPEQAFETLAGGEKIDLLITDLVLTDGRDGAIVAAEARLRCPMLKILLTSGLSESGDPSHSRTNDYPLLPRPYRLSQLADSVRRALQSGRSRILLVEDDLLIRDAVAELLGGHGFQVSCHESAEAALEILDPPSGQTFQAIVADLNLPDMQGIDLLRRVHDLLPDCRLILASGQDPDADALTGLPVRQLRKPFHPAALIALLEDGD